MGQPMARSLLPRFALQQDHIVPDGVDHPGSGFMLPGTMTVRTQPMPRTFQVEAVEGDTSLPRIVRTRARAFVPRRTRRFRGSFGRVGHRGHSRHAGRSEEHTSELQSLMRISYAVFCLKK